MNPLGPLAEWHAAQSVKGRPLIITIVYVVLLYGIAGIILTIWMAESSRRIRPNYEQLFTILHYFTWGAVGVAVLVVTPARMATLVGREKERETLEQLRLTGLTGVQLAHGLLAAVLPLPVITFVAAMPLILLGLGGEAGPLGAIRAYFGLLLLAPMYILFSAHLGLSTKKAAAATSGAIMTTIGLLIVSAVCLENNDEGAKVFALFGPWASGMATLNPHRTYGANDFSVWNMHLPGEFLACAVLGIIAALFYIGFVRRLAGAPGLMFGRTAAFGFAAAMALALGTDAGSLRRWGGWGNDWSVAADMPAEASMVLVLIFSLFLALEAPVRWRDALRSQGNVHSDKAFPQHQRLTVRRFLGGPLVILIGMGLVGAEQVFAEDAPQVAVSGLVLAPLIGIAAWTFAALTFQTLSLITSNKAAVYGLGGAGLAILWFVPLVGAAILDEMGSRGLEYFPMTLNPFAGVIFALDEGNSGGTPNLVLGTLSFAIYAGGSVALGVVIRKRLSVLEDLAAGMVALPADAYAPPGSLTQRCEKGHAFSGVWDRCPHCAELTASELGSPRT